LTLPPPLDTASVLIQRWIDSDSRIHYEYWIGIRATIFSSRCVGRLEWIRVVQDSEHALQRCELQQQNSVRYSYSYSYSHSGDPMNGKIYVGTGTSRLSAFCSDVSSTRDCGSRKSYDDGCGSLNNTMREDTRHYKKKKIKTIIFLLLFHLIISLPYRIVGDSRFPKY